MSQLDLLFIGVGCPWTLPLWFMILLHYIRELWGLSSSLPKEPPLQLNNSLTVAQCLKIIRNVSFSKPEVYRIYFYFEKNQTTYGDLLSDFETPCNVENRNVPHHSFTQIAQLESGIKTTSSTREMTWNERNWLLVQTLFFILAFSYSVFFKIFSQIKAIFFIIFFSFFGGQKRIFHIELSRQVAK